MKMTRLEWTYLQRIALNHPYFDTHKLPLTGKEAKAIVEANNTMTGKEFVDSIYVKLGMTRPQGEKKRFTWLRSIGELFTVPPIRKIAIAVLVVVLMTVFFTATPIGRAIAESVIQYFATLFDDGRLVVNQGSYQNSIELIENTDNSDDYEKLENQIAIVYVDTFDDFTIATEKTPITLPLLHKELYYEYDETIDYLALYAVYEMAEGKIITYQIWDVDDWASSTSMGFIPYDTLDSNNDIYYSIEEDGKIDIKIIKKDSVFTIVSKGNYSLDDLIKMLKEN